ncbi:LysR substrate-binding domain-containing protein [Geodermatophilus sabuli]|uniref:LysR substrate-binding domain-containing protein n=1 Tax=Geodermatophilus sabuli TaxID=1564158 RepID=UPI0017DA3142|nr:LysR substrate-binding domain-containing protein [Geodermatophilus sabuli]MBB3082058.1 DNA-binding transcriptional LysR family regulator [Geodermatophilus sabuli]
MVHITREELDVELRHLRYFAAVADTCHFGAAAQRLHIAQPALSQAIRQLEAELGASLFTRTTRQVQLTPAGRFLREEAERVLAAVDDSVRGVRRIADGRLGLVRIAFTGTAVVGQLPRIARVVKRELPGVALEIHGDVLTPAQCDGLRDGSLDLGVLRPPLSGDGLSLRTIEVEPLVLALPDDHRLVAEPEIAMADLRTEGFVVYADRSSAVNEAVLRSCRDAGFTPHREHEVTGTVVLLALVAAGLGIALVPASAGALPVPGVTYREVADAGSIEVALAWHHREDSPTAGSPLIRSVLGVLETAGLLPPEHDRTRLPTPSPEATR